MVLTGQRSLTRHYLAPAHGGIPSASRKTESILTLVNRVPRLVVRANLSPVVADARHEHMFASTADGKAVAMLTRAQWGVV